MVGYWLRQVYKCVEITISSLTLLHQALEHRCIPFRAGLALTSPLNWARIWSPNLSHHRGTSLTWVCSHQLGRQIFLIRFRWAFVALFPSQNKIFLRKLQVDKSFNVTPLSVGTELCLLKTSHGTKPTGPLMSWKVTTPVASTWRPSPHCGCEGHEGYF